MKSFFKNYIRDPHIQQFAQEQYFRGAKRILSSTTIGQGRIYLIAIPKTTLEDPNRCYVWRAHPFGGVCECPHGSSKKGHQQFIEVLNQHQAGHVINCNTHFPVKTPQYRILTTNLDKDSTKKVFSLDSLSNEQEREYKSFFWELASILKECQRLESITIDTPKTELLSILLRIRFTFKHLKFLSEENEALYLEGLKNILHTKKEILKVHGSYLENNLPHQTLENFIRMGISLSV